MPIGEGGRQGCSARFLRRHWIDGCEGGGEQHAKMSALWGRAAGAVPGALLRLV